MRTIFLAFFLFGELFAKAQPAAKAFSERTETGFALYASNPDWYPVTMLFTMENTNLRFSEGTRLQFVLPPRSEKVRIGELVPIKGDASFKLKYSYRTCMGDVNARPKDTVYLLPYSTGESFLLYQGYNGSFSHTGEKSIDFTMPEGTTVRAIRGGSVVEVVQHNDRQCASPDCKKYNNYITILHADGTFAHYAHIRQNGAQVQAGDTVQAGDPIAYSGNVGYTDGPHLHFAVFSGGFERWTTWPTKFRTEKGVALLREREQYLRNY
ncbi:MAG: M23 family metallopeptidase [Chitinophagaceae bacterium]|nr:MAG: M23 family metallopeptidase [Chitinophagaceae bacterium]